MTGDTPPAPPRDVTVDEARKLADCQPPSIRYAMHNLAAQVERLTTLLEPFACHICGSLTYQHGDYCSAAGGPAERIASALEDEAQVERLTAERERAEARWDTLFDAIAHGDEDHMRWLRDAIQAHREGRSVPPPFGAGKAEAAIARATALAAERDALREGLMNDRDIFMEYAALHRKKGTPDGDAKADRNAAYALRIHALLTQGGRACRVRRRSRKRHTANVWPR